MAWVDFWKRTYSKIDVAATSTDPSDEAAPSTTGSNSPWLVFAPKHMLLLAQSTSARQSWAHVSALVLLLLKSGLLRYEDVHEQAIAVLRQQWPQVSERLRTRFKFFVACVLSSLNRKCWLTLQVV